MTLLSCFGSSPPTLPAEHLLYGAPAKAKLKVQLLIRVADKSVRAPQFLSESLGLAFIGHNHKGNVPMIMFTQLRHVFSTENSPKMAQENQG
jgi:hypothetical protein